MQEVSRAEPDAPASRAPPAAATHGQNMGPAPERRRGWGVRSI